MTFVEFLSVNFFIYSLMKNVELCDSFEQYEIENEKKINFFEFLISIRILRWGVNHVILFTTLNCTIFIWPAICGTWLYREHSHSNHKISRRDSFHNKNMCLLSYWTENHFCFRYFICSKVILHIISNNTQLHIIKLYILLNPQLLLPMLLIIDVFITSRKNNL